MNPNKAAKFVIAISLGAIGAFFATSLFTFVYVSQFSFVLFSILFSFAFSLIAFLLSDEILARLQSKWRTEIVGVFTLLLAGGFASATLWLCLQFPSLFNRRALFMDASDWPLFFALFAVLFITSFFVFSALQKRGALAQIQSSTPFAWVRENLSGLLLFSLFFLVYFSLAQTINFPGFFTVDQYFDIDISTWTARLQTVSPQDITDKVRAVHPAVMLIIRPLVWLAALLLHGSRLQAVFLVHALTASACVFFAWKIVKRATSNSSLGLVAATLLGASASHLVLGSMLETYIYTALALLVFVSLLQNEPISFKSAVLTGVVVFGITVTNFAQTVALYFIKQPRIKTIVLYGLLVAGITLALNQIQVRIYPSAVALAPSNLGTEGRFSTERSDLFQNNWRLRGRISLTGRALLLYGIVAPKPFILTEELGMSVPNFRTFSVAPGEFRVAGYDGLADLAAKAWTLLLVAASALFVWSWREKPWPLLSLGLVACLAFNFLLHVLYGDDPFLYSPDWVYALVLFVAISFQRFASRLWLQIPFAAFLIPLMIVNLGLIRQIMDVSAPFYGH